MSEFVPEPEVPQEPVEEAWSGPTQEEWGEVSETMNLLRQAIQPPQEPEQFQQQQFQQQQQELRDPDDFLTYGEAQEMLRQIQEQQIQPIAQYAERQAQSEGMARAKD